MSKTILIENLNFAELKARRADLVSQAKEVGVNELATRYVQARTDAKQRDERMAEQGVLIADLEEKLAASQQAVAEWQEQANNFEHDLYTLKKGLVVKDKEIASLKEKFGSKSKAKTIADKSE